MKAMKPHNWAWSTNESGHTLIHIHFSSAWPLSQKRFKDVLALAGRYKPPTWTNLARKDPVGVGFPDCRPALGLTLPLWPFLVSWSVPLMSRGSAVQRVGTLVWKRTQNTVRWHTSSFVLGLLCSDLAKPPVWRLKGLESCWGLQKCCRNQYSRNQTPDLESWRTQVYYTGGPRRVNTPSSEPPTKGLQSFYTWTGTIKWVCGFAGPRAIAKSRTRVSEISSSS